MKKKLTRQRVANPFFFTFFRALCVIGNRSRGEVLGRVGVADAYAYTFEGVPKNQKSKITTN